MGRRRSLSHSHSSIQQGSTTIPYRSNTMWRELVLDDSVQPTQRGTWEGQLERRCPCGKRKVEATSSRLNKTYVGSWKRKRHLETVVLCVLHPLWSRTMERLRFCAKICARAEPCYASCFEPVLRLVRPTRIDLWYHERYNCCSALARLEDTY